MRLRRSVLAHLFVALLLLTLHLNSASAADRIVTQKPNTEQQTSSVRASSATEAPGLFLGQPGFVQFSADITGLEGYLGDFYVPLSPLSQYFNPPDMVLWRDLGTSAILSHSHVATTDVIMLVDGVSTDTFDGTFGTTVSFDLSDDAKTTLTQVGIINSFWNGTFDESFTAVATSDGTSVIVTLEKDGGGDLTMNFSDGATVLDCTPATTIALTNGSDSIPTENYCYVLKSTKALTVSTSDWPATEHIKVAYFLVPSAAYVQSDGTYVSQIWNDHKAANDGQGHLSDIGERIRALPSAYESGVEPSISITTNVGTPDNVRISLSSGIVYQMHPQVFAALDMSAGDDAHVVNDSVSPYDSVDDLNTLLTDADGDSMSGRYFNLILWGVINETGEYSPMMINLPTGSYIVLTEAITDSDGYDVYTLPAAFTRSSSTGFLIARLTFRHSVASGGTWTLENTLDLRGQTPDTIAGGSGGSPFSSMFADDNFTIFDDLDDSKEIKFQASGLTTGNTRTYTAPDKDGTLALLSDINATPTLSQVISVGNNTISDPVNYATTSTFAGTATTASVALNVVTDHGLLDGLSDNDHPQYILDADSFGGDVSGTYDNLQVTDDSHSHTSATVTSAQLATTSTFAETATTATVALNVITDHGALDGLSDDDHAQYLLLSGRSGGQSAYGGTGSGDDITLESTSNATKGYVIIQPNGGSVGIGDSAPPKKLSIVDTSSDQIRLEYDTTHYADIGGSSAGRFNIKPSVGQVDVYAATGNVVAMLLRGSSGGLIRFSHDGVTGSLLNSIGDMSINCTATGSDMTFRTENTIALYIDDNQDVHVGGNAPSYKLDVNGTGRFVDDLTLDAALIVDGTGLVYDDATGNVSMGGSLQISGVLGVGLSRTEGSVHIKPSSAGLATANVSADTLVVEEGNTGGISILTPNSLGSNIYFGSPSDPLGAQMNWRYDGNNFTIGTHKTGATLTLESDLGIPVVIISASEDVGIGDLTPSYKLDVNGTGRFVDDLTLDAGLQLATGATSDAILMSDASGNASWQDLNASVAALGYLTTATITPSLQEVTDIGNSTTNNITANQVFSTYGMGVNLDESTTGNLVVVGSSGNNALFVDVDANSGAGQTYSGNVRIGDTTTASSEELVIENSGDAAKIVLISNTSSTDPAVEFHESGGGLMSRIRSPNNTSGIIYIEASDGSFSAQNTNGYFYTDGYQVHEGRHYASANTQVTASTTLTNISNLSVDLVNSSYYCFEADIWILCGATGGFKIGTGGTATISQIRMSANTYDDSSGFQIDSDRISTTGEAISITGYTSAYVKLSGTMACSGSGTFTIQIAQSVSNATPTQADALSKLVVDKF